MHCQSGILVVIDFPTWHFRLVAISFSGPDRMDNILMKLHNQSPQ
jgi:hypothetical protein